MDRLLLGVFCFVVGVMLADAAGGAEGGLRGGKVLLLGDSLLDCHEGENRIEHPMREKLGALRPGVAWEVVNLARGGMWIGPADALARVGLLKDELSVDGGLVVQFHNMILTPKVKENLAFFFGSFFGNSSA